MSIEVKNRQELRRAKAIDQIFSFSVSRNCRIPRTEWCRQIYHHEDSHGLSQAQWGQAFLNGIDVVHPIQTKKITGYLPESIRSIPISISVNTCFISISTSFLRKGKINTTIDWGPSAAGKISRSQGL
jgi:hypothetical protein